MKNAAYIRFLAHELAPYIDENYPTYQMGKGRVLIGDSLGGTVSFMTALMYPHTFGKVVMQSPFVDETVMNLAKEFKEITGVRTVSRHRYRRNGCKAY